MDALESDCGGERDNKTKGFLSLQHFLQAVRLFLSRHDSCAGTHSYAPCKVRKPSTKKVSEDHRRLLRGLQIEIFILERGFLTQKWGA